MAQKKVYLLLLTLLMTMTIAANSFADVSDAGVLFLRIPVGARAVGMGESYVAVADDIFSVHWNPAGLGDPALSGAWVEATIPFRYRPVTGAAALKDGGGSNYHGYEIWALSAQGLVRYDNRNWNVSEVFDTRTDETVRQIVSRYCVINDEARLDAVVERVVAVNNQGTVEMIESFRDEVMAVTSEDYSGYASLKDGFDSLLACYDECRINWDGFNEARQKFADGMKDSTLSEVELDRVDIAVERSRKRFIPEELTVPYAALFSGELTSVASANDMLLVGTTEGLYQYTGSNWRTFTTESGLPSNNITKLYSMGSQVIIGTDKGIVYHNGLAVETFASVDPLPEGPVTAVGGRSRQNVYAVIDNDLYHYDGLKWSNTVNYTMVLDDNLERIVEKFTIYGSDAEKALYRTKLQALSQTEEADAGTVPEAPAETGDVTPPAEIGTAAVDATADSTDAAAVEQPAVVETPPQVMAVEESATGAAQALSVLPSNVRTPSPEEIDQLQPGEVIRIPLLAEIKGNVSDIYVGGAGEIWLGTEYGVVYFDGYQWFTPGYTEHVVAAGETFENLVTLRSESDERFRQTLQSVPVTPTPESVEAEAAQMTSGDEETDAEEITPEAEAPSAEVAEETADAVEPEPVEPAPVEVAAVPYTVEPNAENYIAFLKEFNDLGDEPLDSGQVIKVYAYPNANPVTRINQVEDQLFFATPTGLIVYDGAVWSRAGMKGLGNKPATDIATRDGEAWYISDRSIVVRGRGQSQIGVMAAKLVPELADDIYYSYVGFATHKEGWGTFGMDFKYLTYGTITRTDANGNVLGEFESYEFALAGSYGTQLTNKLSGGITAKWIHSALSEVGAGAELGDGTGSSFGIDVGLLYHMSSRLSFGTAVTNLGPNITYFDAAQADPLPRNLAIGFAYKLKNADQFRILITGEANKGLVGLDDSFSQEIRELIYGVGAEFSFLNLFSARVGYHHDEEGRQKYVTVGAGLHALDFVDFDFGYNPSDVSNAGSANSPRVSLVFSL